MGKKTKGIVTAIGILLALVLLLGLVVRITKNPGEEPSAVEVEEIEFDREHIIF